MLVAVNFISKLYITPETAMGKCVNAQINEHSEYIENVSR